jgi:glycosyltransferase involved in cell wall biosynthesis
MTLIQGIFYGNPDRCPPIVNGARLLAQAGFNLDIFSLDTGEAFDVYYPRDVKVHRLRGDATNAKFQYLQFVKRVLKVANAKDSVLIAHDMHGLLPARLLATLHRRRLVYQSHELVERNRKVPVGMNFVRAFHQRFARNSDLIIVPDADRGEIMKRELRLKGSPLVVANSPTTRTSASGERLKRALLERGYSFEKIVFRQSNIGTSHAIETTIRSLPSWGNAKWGFVVMGPGPDDYLRSLTKLASELNVSDRFVALPPVAYDEVADFTPGADIGHCLYASIDLNNHFSTTASNKLMEYMAAGLPLLVSDRPSLRALVHDNECGLTADERSPDSIASAVNLLLGNPEKARGMGAAARKAFEQEFCYERQFAPVIELLKTLATTSV